MTDQLQLTNLRAAVTSVPWGRLGHAYHGAWDAPDMLGVFLGEGSGQHSIEGAVDWMWGSLLHQGGIYSASIPSLWILIDLLSIQPEHHAATAILRAVESIAWSLLEFPDTDYSYAPVLVHSEASQPLFEVRAAGPLPSDCDEAADDEKYPIACEAPDYLCRSVIEHAVPVIQRALKSRDSEVRNSAAAAGLGALSVVSATADDLSWMVRTIGDPDYHTGIWAGAAVLFGDRGHDLSQLLGHADRRVRLAAALATSSWSDARSVTELRAAVEETGWLEREFPRHIPMADSQTPQFVREKLAWANSA